jgi:hypothetical protein
MFGGEIGKYQNRQSCGEIHRVLGSMMDILKYPCRLLSSKGVHYSEVK